ncbi:MAG: sulfate permease [Nitrospirae bacterium]|nr:sulfate permease [Nitrospirota bacterium]
MRIGPYKFDHWELAGSLGDLGVLLPLMIALITINGLNPVAVFLAVGLTYIVTGLYYRLPMPVQPMKAMSALAIGLGLGKETIAAGGLLMGVLLLLLSFPGILTPLSKLFSRPIIRGIQLSVGLILIKRALGFISVDGWSSIIMGGGGLIVLFLLRDNRRLPISLLVIGFGVVIGFFTLRGGGKGNIDVGSLLLSFPSLKHFQMAFLLLVIPQLPLTIGNALMAARETAHQYFPEQARRVTLPALSRGMGLANLLAGFTGGMPLCHGSGGLTAHYRFGARTGGANIIIGSLFLLGSIFFARPLLRLFLLLPLPILAALLFYVGFQHCLLIRGLKKGTDLFLALLIGSVAILSRNLAIGFGVGIVVQYLVSKRRQKKSDICNLPSLKEKTRP